MAGSSRRARRRRRHARYGKPVYPPTPDVVEGAIRGLEDDPYAELGRILRTWRRGLASRAETLEALRNLDPGLRYYKPAEDWLD